MEKQTSKRIPEGYSVNRPDPLGMEAGAELVRLLEPEVAKHLANGGADERCKTCAFRAGTIPNGCTTTILTIFECLGTGETFECHQTNRKGLPCAGFKIAIGAGRPRKTEAD